MVFEGLLGCLSDETMLYATKQALRRLAEGYDDGDWEDKKRREARDLESIVKIKEERPDLLERAVYDFYPHIFAGKEPHMAAKISQITGLPPTEEMVQEGYKNRAADEADLRSVLRMYNGFKKGYDEYNGFDVLPDLDREFQHLIVLGLLGRKKVGEYDLDRVREFLDILPEHPAIKEYSFKSKLVTGLTKAYLGKPDSETLEYMVQTLEAEEIVKGIDTSEIKDVVLDVLVREAGYSSSMERLEGGLEAIGLNYDALEVSDAEAQTVYNRIAAKDVDYVPTSSIESFRNLCNVEPVWTSENRRRLLERKKKRLMKIYDDSDRSLRINDVAYFEGVTGIRIPDETLKELLKEELGSYVRRKVVETQSIMEFFKQRLGEGEFRRVVDSVSEKSR